MPKLAGKPIDPGTVTEAVCGGCEETVYIAPVPGPMGQTVSWCPSCQSFQFDPDFVDGPPVGVLFHLRDKHPPQRARVGERWSLRTDANGRIFVGPPPKEGTILARSTGAKPVSKKTPTGPAGAGSIGVGTSIWSRLRWLLTGRAA